MAKRRGRKKRNNGRLSDFSPIRRQVITVVLMALALILLLAKLNLAGVAGEFLALGIDMLFGWGSWGVILILIVTGLLVLFGKKIKDKYPQRLIKTRILGLFIIVIALAAVLHIKFLADEVAIVSHRGGGWIGYGLSFVIVKTFGSVASYLIFSSCLLVGLLIAWGGLWQPGLDLEKRREEVMERRKKEQEERRRREEEKRKLKVERAILAQSEENEKRTQNKKFVPANIITGRRKKAVSTTADIVTRQKRQAREIDIPLDLLEGRKSSPAAGDIETDKITIKRTLENFSIPVTMGGVKVGPTVTQYTLRPKEGVKLSKITALSNDLALALAAHPIRIEAPIPGKSLVGIEVPNQRKAIVRIKEILTSPQFQQHSSKLTLALGMDVAGNICIADLAKMPHMLVAGATGSGKTIMLKSIIISLLYQNSPADLKLILVDPKRVEFAILKDLPHLITPVITHVSKTVHALRWAQDEMDRRFDLMAKVRAKDITVYNAKVEEEEKFPYIVIIVDELADLMASQPKEVEGAIIRLAQMARATGIHLIVATQRPSVDVITGLIKANITCRIACAVASMSDSRTILDFGGAEKLLGNGDMLFVSADISKPKRLQGAFVSDEEIKRIVNYLTERAAPEYQEGIVEGTEDDDYQRLGNLKEDELLPEAKELVILAGRGSASLLQRRLRVGYARAARLLDLLEEAGVVGPPRGSKARKVLIKSEEDYVSSSADEDYEDEEADYNLEEDDSFDDDSEEEIEE